MSELSSFSRPPTVFIALDPQCYTEEKEKSDMLGGSERFLLLIKKWLQEDPNRSWWVCADTKPNELGNEYDIAIHSNSFMPGVKAKKHICWAGSTHSDAGWTLAYDEVVNVSKHMQNITKKGIVIPPCITDDLKPENATSFFPGRIVCNVNPHKYIEHLVPMLNVLDKDKVFYNWVFCGGNKLYNGLIPELWDKPVNNKVFYEGILPRNKVIQMLSGGHVFALPAFTGDAPTFEVSPLEAMKLGLTTILPDRSPYNEIHGPLGAIMCDSPEKMAKWVKAAFYKGRTEYDVSRYSEETIKKEWLDLLERML